MPKVKGKRSQLLNEYVKEYGNKVFSTNGDQIYCNVCETHINVTQKSQMDQHINTNVHKSKLMKFNNKSQTFINESMNNLTQLSNENKTFYKELCHAMVASDIPFNKLNNTVFKEFLNKYTQKHIPDESTLRKNYLIQLYD